MSLHDYKRRIADLKQSVSLRSLIETDGHKIIRSGGIDKCCCPFHRERTPSFVIYPDNHAHCFGCHFHGDVFHYVMQSHGVDFKTAVERLSGGSMKSGHVPIRRVQAIKKEPELPRDYFRNMIYSWNDETTRHDLMELCSELGVCIESVLDIFAVWSSRWCAYAFPMRDGDGKIVGIRIRHPSGKKWSVTGSKQGLFMPLSQPQPDLYVTEGPTDCAAMLSMGLYAIGKAAAMQGPEEILKFIHKNRIRRVIVIADNDTAGLKGAKKLIDVCPVPCCELVLPAKDAREFYRNGGTKELIENLTKSAVWRTPGK